MLGIRKFRKIALMLADIAIYILVAGVIYISVYSARYDFSLIAFNLGLMCLCMVLINTVLHTYDSLWRYAEAREYLKVFLGSALGYAAYRLIRLIIFKTPFAPTYMLTVCTCSMLGSVAIRMIYRIYRGRKLAYAFATGGIRDIAIIGAGDAGVALYDEMARSSDKANRTYCFFDDDKRKIGTRIHGVNVKGPISELAEQLRGTPVNEVVLAIPSLSLERRREIFDLCSSLKCKIKVVPDTVTLLENSDNNLTASVRDFAIEDLLGRATVDFERENTNGFMKGKVVLVTGGGGSIGSELCRQISKCSPKKLIILDIYENTAYTLQCELRRKFSELDLAVEIANICDASRLDHIFSKHRPQIVFHAAAHKHVPLMEYNPDEAVKNNIFATHNLMFTAKHFQCQKFILISTDKAVNPTNVMGATKRYCEMMAQSIHEYRDCRTEFAAVRFGNVLGSNGSVIPLFMEQIKNGGPVTVTDKRITRYFMTIPEAASLVLKAGAMAKSSEIFVLDMGEPVKILELAENLIRLSGYVPYKDIQIIETGLRPGEKLYEELLIDRELHSETMHNKIFIENSEKCTLNSYELERGLDMLQMAIDTHDNERIIETLRKLVPSFRNPDDVNNIVVPDADELVTHQADAELQSA